MNSLNKPFVLRVPSKRAFNIAFLSQILTPWNANQALQPSTLENYPWHSSQTDHTTSYVLYARFARVFYVRAVCYVLCYVVEALHVVVFTN